MHAYQTQAEKIMKANPAGRSTVHHERERKFWIESCF